MSFDSWIAERREQQRFQLKRMEETLKRYQHGRARDESFRFIKRVKRGVAASEQDERYGSDSLIQHRDNSPIQGNTDTPISTEQAEGDEELLFDTDLPIPSVSEDDVIPVTKVCIRGRIYEQIYYCSRTHSQLAQVMEEFLHSEWSKEMHCSILGGRRSLCVNPSVNRLPTDAQITDQCLYLQRNRSRGKKGCTFHNREKEESLRNEILVVAVVFCYADDQL